jgi:hypothetical protein
MMSACWSLLGCILSLSGPMIALAEESMASLPSVLSAQPSQEPWRRVGGSTYRKWGFKVYEATLWAPDGIYDEKKSFALQLRYARKIPQKTLIDAIMDDFSGLPQVDRETLQEWRARLTAVLPAVVENQELIGLSRTDQPARLFSDGRLIGELQDPILERAFFGIWVGDHADPQMRRGLLGR